MFILTFFVSILDNLATFINKSSTVKKTNKPKSDPALNNPHNNFFIKNLSNKNIAKGYIRCNLPLEIVNHLDFRTIKLSVNSFIDANLQPHYSDLIYTCKWKGGEKVYISIIIEHQSKKPSIPHLKMLRYLLNGYDYQIAQPTSKKIKKGGRNTLKVITPMFVYHGKAKWEFRPFSDFFIHLVATLLLLKHYRDKNYIIEQTGEILSFAQEYSEEGGWLDVFVYQALIYVSSGVKVNEEEVKQIVTSVSNKLKDPIMTAYEKITSKAEQKGIEQAIIIVNLIKKHPKSSDKEIAELAKVPLGFVKKIRNGLF